MVNLYPQTPVIEIGDLIDFSAEEEQPDEPPAEELVLGTNFTVLCPAPTAVSVELQQTSPAEDLATGQRVQDLCPTPVAVSEAQGEKVAITPQQRSVHLGDSTIDMSSNQPDEGMEKEAAGSPPQWQLHSLGVEEASLLPQQDAGNREECYQPLPSTSNNYRVPGRRGSRPPYPTVSRSRWCGVSSRRAGNRAEDCWTLPSTNRGWISCEGGWDFSLHLYTTGMLGSWPRSPTA
ncbi:hypothetical protein AB205_0103350 [Aquarana catesbeiana]|uniref:Uncharacterized protein n=1 Tax=Aquarana catesbeiana TaxID=8400 RepID=A0A2G9Q2L4_AQUCT|nr:hypothetical protein AB205_0103350 [Aquarana catesbeiana]